ncbi:5'-methylthioadenosine/S-adenosylhomocysteine nucleosidase family protein [Aspergillus homomorphus CBS 101889]|uniref:Purine and uridine phosphorylase n=1 Tax=Aspergillus homomorphus (strain CBS 101889) TaxID=1450537 RepID=A0A395HQL1_ASPHC|nr:purine and uridine phosphorylase [Aspergillus homomorphus CBS 101889]RAL08534.1 purine and uridine phosphorylase [Aspergillus homomorphus CBS 101889]
MQPEPSPATSDSDSEEDFPDLVVIQPEEISVAIFCALPLESVAVRYSLDQAYKCRPKYSNRNQYVYSFGRIGEHKVVLARPHQIGPVKAALCAAAVSHQFPNVQFALMVGIGAGIPTLPKRDIRLGDVVVGIPQDDHPGVLEYDLGKYEKDGFVLKGSLNKPHPMLISADGSLKEDEIMGHNPLRKILRPLTKNPGYGRPKLHDVLYDPTFHHVSKGGDCSACEVATERKAVSRPARTSKRNYPVVHRGLILSGGGIIQNPEDRERLRRGYDDALCFENSAAGVMDAIPCLVIRGIYDYADTHKQDGWHRYAAAAAAAYCKAVLCKIDGPDEPAVTVKKKTGDALEECESDVPCHAQSGDMAWSEATRTIPPRRLLPNSELACDTLYDYPTASALDRQVHWYNGGNA